MRVRERERERERERRDMSITEILLTVILVSDFIFAITVVFWGKKSPTAIMAWLMVFYFLPVVGFILYIFLGQNYRKEKMFQIKKDVDQALISFIKSQKSELRAQEITVTDHLSSGVLRQMILMLLENNNAVLTTDNQVKIYTDGNDKFTDLISAIKGARDHIHLEYLHLER